MLFSQYRSLGKCSFSKPELTSKEVSPISDTHDMPYPRRWQSAVDRWAKNMKFEFSPFRWLDETDECGTDRQPMMSYSYLINDSSIFLSIF